MFLQDRSIQLHTLHTKFIANDSDFFQSICHLHSYRLKRKNSLKTWKSLIFLQTLTRTILQDNDYLGNNLDIQSNFHSNALSGHNTPNHISVKWFCQ